MSWTFEVMYQAADVASLASHHLAILYLESSADDFFFSFNLIHLRFSVKIDFGRAVNGFIHLKKKKAQHSLFMPQSSSWEIKYMQSPPLAWCNREKNRAPEKAGCEKKKTLNNTWNSFNWSLN